MQHSLGTLLAAAARSPDTGPPIRFETEAVTATWPLGRLLAAGEAFWRARPLPPCRRVLIAMAVSPEAVGLYLAAIHRGLVPAFLAPLTEKQREDAHWRQLAALARRAEAAMLLVDGAALAPARASIQVPGLTIEAPAPFDFQADLEASPGAPSGEGEVAFLQYSSGTTGARKAVAIRHDMLARQVAAYRRALDLRSSDVMVSWLPLYHDMGLIACLMLPLICGLPLVLLDPVEWARRPALLLQAIERHRGTLAFLPNFAFHHLALTVPADETADLSGMRAFVNCSETCSESAFERFHDRFGAQGATRAMLQTCYAMAEAVFAVTQSAPGTTVASLATAAPGLDVGTRRIAPDTLSSGRPIPGVEIEIRDDSGRCLDDRQVGEIHLRGPALFAGYEFADAGAPKPVDGWFATGDLGLLCGGELFVVGRSKDVIIVNGRNLMAPEIEAVAAEVDGIKPGRAVAFGCWQDATGSEALTVLAEPRRALCDAEDGRALSRRLRQRIFERIGVHPTVRIVPPKTLIKTTSGKLSRARNRQLYEEAR